MCCFVSFGNCVVSAELDRSCLGCLRLTLPIDFNSIDSPLLISLPFLVDVCLISALASNSFSNQTTADDTISLVHLPCWMPCSVVVHNTATNVYPHLDLWIHLVAKDGWIGRKKNNPIKNWTIPFSYFRRRLRRCRVCDTSILRKTIFFHWDTMLVGDELEMKMRWQWKVE